MDLDRLSALPQAFLHRMEDMLGDDFEPFLAAYEQPRTYGLRVNTAKISCEEFEQIVPFEVKKIPWVSNGYFYNEDVRPSRGSAPDTSMMRKAAPPDALTTRQDFIIFRNQVP